VGEHQREEQPSVDDLDPLFKLKVRAFLKALQDAGATVTIGTTRRSDKRAYLFHWSWRIAVGNAKASAATAKAGRRHPLGSWQRGGQQARRPGDGRRLRPRRPAEEHQSAVARQPPHPRQGDRHDDPCGSGTLKVKKHGGGIVDVSVHGERQPELEAARVGASYGVLKLKTDAPHWSLDGH
jgi:hypothetical protein